MQVVWTGVAHSCAQPSSSPVPCPGEDARPGPPPPAAAQLPGAAGLAGTSAESAVAGLTARAGSVPREAEASDVAAAPSLARRRPGGGAHRVTVFVCTPRVSSDVERHVRCSFAICQPSLAKRLFISAAQILRGFFGWRFHRWV